MVNKTFQNHDLIFQRTDHQNLIEIAEMIGMIQKKLISDPKPNHIMVNKINFDDEYKQENLFYKEKVKNDEELKKVDNFGAF